MKICMLLEHRARAGPLSVKQIIDAPNGSRSRPRRRPLHAPRSPAHRPGTLSRAAEVSGALPALTRASAGGITDADTFDTAVANTGFGRCHLPMYIVETLSLSPERIKAAIRRDCADLEEAKAVMAIAAEVRL